MEAHDRRTFLKKASLLAGSIGLLTLSGRAGKNDSTNPDGVTRKTIFLWPEESPNNQIHDKFGRPRLDIWLPAREPAEKRPAIIVCPGGGYRSLAPHEGAPFAELFAAHGMVAAVLTYRISPHRFPAPYADGVRAVRLLRSEADSLGVDGSRIGILGFSAGGHLASTVATQPELYADPEDDLAGNISARPESVMLGYPVISLQEPYGHRGSVQQLLGPDPNPALVRQLSNDLQVTENTPPAFLFHTSDDPGVPVQNSMRFAAACHEKQVPVALHVYAKGRHGVGMALRYPELKSWTGLLLDWLGDWKG